MLTAIKRETNCGTRIGGDSNPPIHFHQWTDHPNRKQTEK